MVSKEEVRLILRSLCFDAIYYVSFGIFCLYNIFLLPLPKKWLEKQLWLFSKWVLYVLHTVLGVECRVSGEKSEGACVVAAKHQSSLDIFLLIALFQNPAFVLKASYTRWPFFNFYAQKSSMISVRRGTRKDINTLLKGAQRVFNEGRPLIIFPEGRRTYCDERPPLKSGIWFLAQHYSVPMLAVALKTGHVWPRKAFFKRSGIIDVSIKTFDFPLNNKKTWLKHLHDALNTLKTAS